MEPTLVIIGLNFRTAPVAVRERFWMSEAQRSEALQQLVRSEGIDEIIILDTCDRTEFIFWASDPAEGANSVLRFLTRAFDLKLSEWSSFYRLMDDNALLHLFRVATGLDSMVIGDRAATGHLKRAWNLSQRAGTMGRILDAVIQKTFSASERARSESGITQAAAHVAAAVVRLCKGAGSEMGGSKVLVLGCGAQGEQVLCNLVASGAKDITLANRKLDAALALAGQIKGKVVRFESRLEELAAADIVITATSSPDAILTLEQVEAALTKRRRPLVIADLGVPRNVTPSVRQLPGVILFDIDDFERELQDSAQDREPERVAAEGILQEEVTGFRRKLVSENILPTIVALRNHLEEICGQELRSLEDQYGPFTEDQQSALHSLAQHITQRIASTMARELKGMPEKADQQLLTEAVQRLFHLQPAKASAPALKH